MRCTLLEVGKVYLEHTTLRVSSETTTSSRRIMLSNYYFFTISIFNTSLIKQTKNLIVSYQNNIENEVCHNSGHATIAAPTGCSVVDDDIVQEPCEKRGGDLEQIATEWISTEMHSNYHGMSAEPKRPLYLSWNFFYQHLKFRWNFQQK